MTRAEYNLLYVNLNECMVNATDNGRAQTLQIIVVSLN